MKLRGSFKYLLLIGVTFGAFSAVNRAQDILDWWKLRDYTPSAVIEALAINSSMNDEGRKLFYVHDPELLQKDTFAEKCTVGEETIVLGCYVSRQNIFLFDVSDKRLEGVEEVAAAHEMLHAAYDRLSLNELDEINELLELAFSRIDDPRIIKKIESYRKRDPSIVSNELHSILGTEARNLPQGLENHYARYFEDRQKVVDIAEVYADEFRKLEAQIEAFDAQLENIRGDIARREAEIELNSQALIQERKLIQGLSDNPVAYNIAVGVYNSKVAGYNRDIEALKSLIEEHNEIVGARNKIALEEQQLVEAIDTRVDEI